MSKPSYTKRYPKKPGWYWIIDRFYVGVRHFAEQDIELLEKYDKSRLLKSNRPQFWSMGPIAQPVIPSCIGRHAPCGDRVNIKDAWEKTKESHAPERRQEIKNKSEVMKTLKAFCKKNESRFDYSKPFTQNGYTYASDSMVVIRTKKIILKKNNLRVICGTLIVKNNLPPIDAVKWDVFPLSRHNKCFDRLINAQKKEYCDCCVSFFPDDDNSPCRKCRKFFGFNFPNEYERFAVGKKGVNFEIKTLRKIAKLKCSKIDVIDDRLYFESESFQGVLVGHFS